jgi:hypothetical protein
MITDTKTVWAEGAFNSHLVSVRRSFNHVFMARTVLSKQQLSRRWSTLNNNSASSHLPHPDEDAWLDQLLQYLVDVHTPHAMGDLSFDVIDSRYSVLGTRLVHLFRHSQVFSGSSHPLSWRGVRMEMGDLFRWTQAIGRGAFEAPCDPPSQHRLPGFHLPGRYQRDLRQRSRKGRLQQSHTIMSTLVSDWRGARG